MRLGLSRTTPEMSEKEQALRSLHEEELVQKLKNPNNVVSKTRVMLKNISKKNLTE